MSGGFFNKFLTMVGLEDVEDDYDEIVDEEEYMDDSDFEEPEFEEQPRREKRRGKVVDMPPVASSASSRMRVVVYQPNSNEDTENIIDNLRASKPVIINLDELDIEVAQRALDYISGAVYALSANIQKVARSIYVVTPNGVDIALNASEEDNAYSIRNANR